jgi:Omp85 superfamily domain
MLTRAVAHYRGILTFTLCALPLAAADRPALAQVSSAVSSNAVASPDATAASPDAQSSRPPRPPTESAPDGFLAEPHAITRSINFVTGFSDSTDAPKSGFYPEFSNMIAGADFLSAGPGYRHYFADDRVLVDGSAAVSWHLYKMAQGRVEMPKLAAEHLLLGAQAMWQDATQVNYFGVGPNSLEANRSQYRMQTTDFVGYATAMPSDWLSIGGEYGFLKQPKVMKPGGTFVGNFPQTRDEFPADAGAMLTSQPDFWHGEASLTADTRDHRSYPSTGSMYRGAATSYVSEGASGFTFRHYEVEGAQYIPLADRRWVLAFRGWALYSRVPTGNQIPFYLLPTIGGSNTLRDFLWYRFHDNNTLVVNAESRFGLYQHLDLAVFYDAGNVAAAFDDLNLRKKSYGAGVRLHTDTTTIGRMDVAYGSEGWRFVVRTSDPFRLSREQRKVVNAPFTP